MENKKILIVEDEAPIAEMYKTQLELAGFEVMLARDGYEGLIRAVKEQPHLILLDIVMPRLNGWQTLKQLRDLEETKDLIICILSNLDNQPEVKRGLEAGADYYFSKTAFTPGELLLQLQQLPA